MKLEQKPKTLLIDLDGTLLGSKNLSLQLKFISKTGQSLKEKNPRLSWIKILRILKKVSDVMSHPSSSSSTNLKRAAELFSKLTGETEEFYLKVLRGLFPSLKDYFYPIEPAKRFLDWAQSSFDLVLATNPVWPEDIIQMRLAWGGIPHHLFRIITHAELMQSTKPHLHYYEETLKLAHRSPEECLLIGNDLKMDLPAARANIPVFIVSKNKNIKPIRVSKNWAPAWRGTYDSLKNILEST